MYGKVVSEMQTPHFKICVCVCVCIRERKLHMIQNTVKTSYKAP